MLGNGTTQTSQLLPQQPSSNQSPAQASQVLPQQATNNQSYIRTSDPATGTLAVNNGSARLAPAPVPFGQPSKDARINSWTTGHFLICDLQTLLSSVTKRSPYLKAPKKRSNRRAEVLDIDPDVHTKSHQMLKFQKVLRLLYVLVNRSLCYDCSRMRFRAD